ncbi:hypothetical protein A5630_20770 [Mycolicibacterium mucogenicum]|uniref:Uncharacterized protein n=1 Tax=Mycolicibacterium mucogenicum TaxID=56689 RepID=A0A1A3H3C9_MYCMU|nr:hypothetical protein [Mycolicibacterium mucogenicum]OBJ42545.1 hypothetical protein A5630_20770 [Mycolicibacterium mucogenicum]
MGDDSDFDDTDSVNDPRAQYRERREHAQAQARLRYRDHLTAVLAQQGVARPDELAEVALDALTLWQYVDSGASCRCSCHPQLPDTDLHNYGRDCPCTQSKKLRSRAMQNWRNDIETLWPSPEGQRRAAADAAAKAKLIEWLTTQPAVTIHSHGGFAPEQWRGDVDGHSFKFRERHGQWGIEIDLRPSGTFIRYLAGTEPDGGDAYQMRELERGELIAYGTIGDAGYGATYVERARFIIDTIRAHLTRQTCAYHLEDLGRLDCLLGVSARWCPLCGTRLARHR